MFVNFLGDLKKNQFVLIIIIFIMTDNLVGMY